MIIFVFLSSTHLRSNTITSRVGRAKVESILGSVTFEDENGGPTFPPLGVLFANASVGMRLGRFWDVITEKFEP